MVVPVLMALCLMSAVSRAGQTLMGHVFSRLTDFWIVSAQCHFILKITMVGLRNCYLEPGCYLSGGNGHGRKELAILRDLWCPI